MPALEAEAVGTGGGLLPVSPPPLPPQASLALAEAAYTEEGGKEEGDAVAAAVDAIWAIRAAAGVAVVGTPAVPALG